MQIKCLVSELLPAVQEASRVISRRNYIPVLNGLEIRTNDLIEMRATDMEISLEAVIKGQVIEEGVAVVPARLLLDILKTLPQETVELKTIDNITHLDCQNIHFELQGFNPEDYPPATEAMIGSGLRVPSNILKKLIHRTIKATSSDENRPALQALLWQIKENLLTLVATDSYRLAVAEAPLEEERSMDILVPASACHLLQSLLSDNDEVIVLWDDNKINFGFREHHLEARLIAAKHFDWQPLLPLVFVGQAELTVKDLEQALRRVNLLSSKETQVVKFSFEPERLTLWTQDRERGEAKEELAVSWPAEPLAVGLNASFVLDGLSVLPGERVLFQIDESKQKVLLQDPQEKDFSYLLMAVKMPEGW